MSDAETVREVTESHNTELGKAFAAGDLDRYGEFIAEDCWQMNPGSEPFVGREALVAGWRKQQELGK